MSLSKETCERESVISTAVFSERFVEMGFEIEVADESGKKVLLINGNIDEDAIFPELELGNEEVEVEMKNVKAVNSVGIRSWLKWITPIAEQTRFVFRNCPKSVVLQMNMVEGFLPKSATVKSLLVPFYSETQDEEKDALFVVGQDVTIENGSILVKFDVSELGGDDWEMDVNESKYFKFLKAE